MFKFFLSVILLAHAQTAASQSLTLDWAKAFLGNNPWNSQELSNGRTVGVDQQGNVYSAGLFQHSVDFDPGPGVYTLVGGGSSGFGIFISKLDANGNFVWAKQLPILVEFGEVELKVDLAGNVYLVSDLRATADMDPGPGVLTMTPTGAKDAFVIKLDTNGNLVWAKQFGGPGDTVPNSSSLDIDKNNDVIICGLFNRTVDFDPGPGIFNLTSTAHMQSYIVKLSSNGTFIWATQFGHSPVVYSGASIADVKCDPQGNIYAVGTFGGTCDFDPGPGVYSLTGASGDGFIAKLTTGGNLVWVKHIKSLNLTNNYHTVPRGIDLDNMNNVVTTGRFIGDFDFDPGPGVSNVFSNPYDCYILKLTEQGDFVWAKTIGGSQSDAGNDLVVDNDNNIYIVGEFGPSVDLDPGPSNHTISSSYLPGAVIKLTAGGNFVYAAPFTSIGYGTGIFRRMATDASKNIYIAGLLAGTIDYDPGTDVFPLSATSSQSPFVVKLTPCKNVTTSTLNISVCNNYQINNETFTATGTYTQTILNSLGCDSIITLHLTINKKETRQSKSICEGEAFIAGGANQTTSGTYIDIFQTTLGCDSIVTTTLTVIPKPRPNLGPDKTLCDDTQLNVTPGPFANYQWQNMSTSNNFTISTAGIYWVRVTDNYGCSATDTLNIPMITPAPSNFLKEQDSICSIGGLNVHPYTDYSLYLWSNGSTGRTATINNPGTYWLQVTDANGCTGADTITIVPKQCLNGCYVPNAFTPNGDNKNDVLKPLLFGKVKQYRFTIYNRWGTRVFETTEPQKGWDGTVAGIMPSSGIFVWTLVYHLEGSEQKKEKGTVTLIK